MAMLVLTALLIVLGSLLLRAAYNTISCYWLTPRRIKKIMGKQGVGSPKPQFLVENIMDVEKKDTQPEIHEVAIAVYTEDDTPEEEVIISPVTNLPRAVVSDMFKHP